MTPSNPRSGGDRLWKATNGGTQRIFIRPDFIPLWTTFLRCWQSLLRNGKARNLHVDNNQGHSFHQLLSKTTKLNQKCKWVKIRNFLAKIQPFSGHLPSDLGGPKDKSPPSIDSWHQFCWNSYQKQQIAKNSLGRV